MTEAIHSFRDQLLSRFDEETKRLDELEIGEAMEPAKLNEEFIMQPAICLEDLKPGESARVLWNEMAVDPECHCYIDPKAAITHLTLTTISVTRTDAGFEVLIPANPLAPLRWKRGTYNLELDKDYARYVPVIRVEYAQAQEGLKESEKLHESIQRNLAVAERINREIAKLQKEIDKSLRKRRNKGEEGGK